LSGKQITVNGQDLAYVEAGQGAPVVLIHGSVDDLRTWSYQMAPFGERRHVIAYSRRYHWPNRGGDDASTYRATDHRDDLAALLDQLARGSAHIVGASYGAVVGLRLAAPRPGMVRSLVLGEPPAFNLLPDAQLLANQEKTVVPARRFYETGNAEAGIESFLNAVVGPGAFARFPARAREAALENAAEFGAELRSTNAEYFGPLTANDLGGIQVPTLLMRGDRSPGIFGQVMDVLVERLPHAKHLVVPNASHAMHRHNAPVYNAAVLDFLSSVEGSDGAGMK
jgi:non-heme chloroperoxidase